MCKWFVVASACSLVAPASAQLGTEKGTFTKADSLRGSNGPYRAWWDVVQYDVSVRPDPSTRSIVGTTQIAFDALTEGQRMQVDLQQPLVVDSILTEVASFKEGAIMVMDQAVPFQHEGNVVWVELPHRMKQGEASSITVHYHGVPIAAKNPPWDGGWIWKTDKNGAPWMSVACQGLGASAWYPCKDLQSDEPDRGASLHITVPDGLQAIGNGRLRTQRKNADGTTTWDWQVKSPINTYNLVPYIGKYAHWSDVYEGVSGKLDLDYWVLEANAEKARAHFEQVKPMLACFEQWLGPYPFYADGYKLVEAPHLGMEHQSAVAYGNQYRMGYLGMDRSGTGRGLLWDYIIIHESGHEWFGNSITTADIADMWVHEGFTDYTETIYTECQQGKKAAEEYVIGLRNGIANDRPLIGPYGVNQEGSGDMYNKGANLIHTIRHIIGDSTFKAMLLGMIERFRHKVVTSADIEDYMINFNERTKAMLNKSIFDQYLRTIEVPTLEWGIRKRKLIARWTNCQPGFVMPVWMELDGRPMWKEMSTGWSVLATGNTRKLQLSLNRNWYANIASATRIALKNAALPRQASPELRSH